MPAIFRQPSILRNFDLAARHAAEEQDQGRVWRP
jgi:hypothetical protein